MGGCKRTILGGNIGGMEGTLVGGGIKTILGGNIGGRWNPTILGRNIGGRMSA